MLSLSDFLAEAEAPGLAPPLPPGGLGKEELRGLSEALFHAAEAGRTEIALDLRNLGVPWTMGTWLAVLSEAVEQRRKSLTQRLLTDFTERLADDLSPEFLDDGLPLLLDVFAAAKSETVLAQVGGILATLFGPGPLPPLPAPDPAAPARIDAAYVNSPELSDVTFRLQGRLFYAHKIVLANASPQLKALIAPGAAAADPDGAITLHDTTYDVFEVRLPCLPSRWRRLTGPLQLVMGYLYRGSLERSQSLSTPTLLQLLAAAYQYGLGGLSRLPHPYAIFPCSLPCRCRVSGTALPALRQAFAKKTASRSTDTPRFICAHNSSRSRALALPS